MTDPTELARERATVAQEYWALEAELGRIAALYGMSIQELTKTYEVQPEAVRDLVRPILWKQLEHLDEMRKWRLKGNISVFPISCLRRY